jgi:hypothetical protein
MKMKLFSSAVTLILCVFFISSCSKQSCDENASDGIVAAATKYVNDPSKANCLAYKKSLEDYLDKVDGCPGVTAALIQESRDDLKALTCD